MSENSPRHRAESIEPDADVATRSTRRRGRHIKRTDPRRFDVRTAQDALATGEYLAPTYLAAKAS